MLPKQSIYIFRGVFISAAYDYFYLLSGLPSCYQLILIFSAYILFNSRLVETLECDLPKRSADQQRAWTSRGAVLGYGFL